MTAFIRLPLLLGSSELACSSLSVCLYSASSHFADDTTLRYRYESKYRTANIMEEDALKQPTATGKIYSSALSSVCKCPCRHWVKPANRAPGGKASLVIGSCKKVSKLERNALLQTQGELKSPAEWARLPSLQLHTSCVTFVCSHANHPCNGCQ